MLPGISCLMPTTWRRRWCIPLAIEWFQRQTYEGALELVVISEDAGVLYDLIPTDARIRVLACERGLALGGKHELAAKSATHGWLAKWDDDDWQSPIRLEMTMRAAKNANARMVSAEPLLFYELGHGRCFEYRYGLTQKWQPGNSLLVAREVWEKVGFRRDLGSGVDTDFVGRALAMGVDGLIVEDAPLTVVMKHGQTTGMRTWKPAPPEFRPWNGDLAGLLGADLAAFEEAFCQKSTSPACAQRPGVVGPSSPGPRGGSPPSATSTPTSS